MTRPPRARICRAWTVADDKLFGALPFPDNKPWEWVCDGDPSVRRVAMHGYAASWQAALDALARHQGAEHPEVALPVPGCPCAACNPAQGLWWVSMMHVCPDCGNKRCPKAADHRKWMCSSSNEPGQIGVRA